MSILKYSLLDNLFRRHSMELVAFANQRGCDLESEDLVQEAYLRLLQHPNLESINNPRAYLYKITANLGSDHHRRKTILGRHIETAEVEPDSVTSPLPGPEALTEGELLLRKCLAALETLPEVYRHVFLLHRIDGLSHKEIAEALQLPRRTVERYCAKALAHCFSYTIRDQN